MYFLLKILTKLIRNIPRKAGYSFFELIASVMYLFGGKRRRTLEKNLSNVIGSPAPVSVVKEAYRNYARYYFDLFCTREEILSGLDDSYYKPCYDLIKRSCEQRGGCLLVSMHLGNWDAGGAFISQAFPGRVDVVVEELSPPVYKWFTETRQGWGMGVIGSKNLRSMVKTLKSGKLLVLVGDRDLEKNGYQMDFFGKKAYIPAGPATLALMANVPVITAVMYRTGKDGLGFTPVPSGPPLNVEPMERTPENTEKLAKQITEQMEAAVKSHPEQWCMLQQVWVE